MRKIISLILATIMIAALCLVPASAVVPVDPQAQEVKGSVAQSGVSPVEVKYEAQLFKISIPSTFPVYVDGTGIVYTATNTPIINRTASPIQISATRVEAINAYELVSYDTDFKVVSIGSKKAGIRLFGQSAENNVPNTGSATIPARFQKIDGNTQENIGYNVVVSAQNRAITASPLKVIFTVNWFGATSPQGADYTFVYEDNGDGTVSIVGIDHGKTDTSSGNTDLTFPATSPNGKPVTKINMQAGSGGSGGSSGGSIGRNPFDGYKYNKITVPCGSFVLSPSLRGLSANYIWVGAGAHLGADCASGSSFGTADIDPSVTVDSGAFNGTNMGKSYGVTFATQPIDSQNPDAGSRITGVTFKNSDTSTLDLEIPAVIPNGKYGNTTGKDIIIKEFDDRANAGLRSKTFNSIKVATKINPGALGGITVDTLELLPGANMTRMAVYRSTITNLKYPSTGVTINPDAWYECIITNINGVKPDLIYTTEPMNTQKPLEGNRIVGVMFNVPTETLDLVMPSVIKSGEYGNTTGKDIIIKEFKSPDLRSKTFNSIKIATKIADGVEGRRINGYLGGITANTVEILPGADIPGKVGYYEGYEEYAKITNLKYPSTGAIIDPKAWYGSDITNTYIDNTKPDVIYTTEPMNTQNPLEGSRINNATFNVPTETLDLVIPSVIKPGEYGNMTGKEIIIKEFRGRLANRTFNSIKIATKMPKNTYGYEGYLSQVKVNTLELLPGAELEYYSMHSITITNLKYPSTGVTIDPKAWSEGCNIANINGIKQDVVYTTVPIDTQKPLEGSNIYTVKFNVPTETLDMVIPAVIKPGEYGNATNADIIIKEFRATGLSRSTFNSIKIAIKIPWGGTIGMLSGSTINTLEVLPGADIPKDVGYNTYSYPYIGATITNLKYPSTGAIIDPQAWNGCTITNTYIDGVLQQK